MNSGLVFAEDLKLIADKIAGRVAQVKKERKGRPESVPPVLHPCIAACSTVEQSTVNVCCESSSCATSCTAITSASTAAAAVSCAGSSCDTGYATLSDATTVKHSDWSTAASEIIVQGSSGERCYIITMNYHIIILIRFISKAVFNLCF